MQKENRNNRVHTGEQSGKTDFLIERLLPVGKENAITTQDLVKLSGCGSARELQQRIYAIYPKKRGKQRAFGLYCQWLKGRVIQGERIKLTNKEMYVAVRNYVRQQEQEQPDQKYWKNFDTLMGATLLDYVDKGEINE